jgi:uncharacterized DUF497 family protein
MPVLLHVSVEELQRESPSISQHRIQMGWATVGLQFEWDPDKAGRNQHKHRTTFEEAATVFADALAVTVLDPDHSVSEERYITVGLSQHHRLLMVAHTERGGRIRIISARGLTATEKRDYEQG